MNRSKRFLKRAEEEAIKSSDNFRVGAVLIRGGNIIGYGHNQGWKSHPIQAQMYPERDWKGIHAEIAALKGLRPYDVKKGIMFVVRLKVDGSWGMAKPCSNCEDYLRRMNVHKVVYSTDVTGGFGSYKLGR